MLPKVSIDAHTKSIELYSHIQPYTHKQAIYGYTPISIYKGEREGGGWRGLEGRILHLGGNGIIVFFYISMEGCGKGWERVAEYILMGVEMFSIEAWMYRVLYEWYRLL